MFIKMETLWMLIFYCLGSVVIILSFLCTAAVSLPNKVNLSVGFIFLILAFVLVKANIFSIFWTSMFVVFFLVEGFLITSGAVNAWIS